MTELNTDKNIQGHYLFPTVVNVVVLLGKSNTVMNIMFLSVLKISVSDDRVLNIHS